jgi:CheY-like chemotaxis protein
MERKPPILIAEDDFEDRYIMSETFIELGRVGSIQLIENGTKLIEYLNEWGPDDVKLIILDLNMPLLNGTEILRLLKKHKYYNQIPVIIFSTSVNEIEKKACMQLGAKEYVTKPSRHADYLQTCQKFYDISQGYVV